jgi:hypothetical protein
VAGTIDYAQYLIERGDVYDPDAAPTSLPALALIPITAAERRWSSRFDAVRVLLAMCVISWSVVAVETWLLLR